MDSIRAGFQRRRQKIAKAIADLKRDADSWNENHPGEKPIMIVTDLTNDVLDDEARKEGGGDG